MFSKIMYVLVIILAFSAFQLPSANLQERRVLTHVEEKERVSLGVAVKSVDADRLKKYGLKGGAEIIEVIGGSEAEKIGLREGDLIVNFAGNDIITPAQLHEKISLISEESRAEITVNREGKSLKFQAMLKPAKPRHVVVRIDSNDLKLRFDKLQDIPKIMAKKIKIAPQKGGYLGVQTENLTDQLKEYFQVENGVLIAEVIDDSPAAGAGLKGGDVITGIDGKKVLDYSDLVRILNYYDPGTEVAIKYSRRGKLMSVKITLGEKKGRMLGLNHPDGKPDFVDFYPPHLPEIDLDLEKLKDLEKELEGINIDIDMYII